MERQPLKLSHLVILGLVVLTGVPLAGVPLYLVGLEAFHIGFGLNRPSIILVVSGIAILGVAGYWFTKGELTPRKISKEEHEKLVKEYWQSRQRVMLATLVAMLLFFWLMIWRV